MKSKFLLTFLACFLLSFSFVSGQEVSLDNVQGTMWNNQPDSIMPGSTYIFDIRFNNPTSSNISGFTIPFHVYSPDGATWTNTVSDSTGLLGKSLMDGGVLITYPADGANVNGTGADTSTFGAFVFFNPGLPPGFNEVSFTVEIGPVGIDDAGKTICLDSVTFPQNAWKWVEKGQPDIIPSWDGPHCFAIGGATPETPPELAPIGAQSVDEGQELVINVSATDAEGSPITLTTSTLPAGAIFTETGNGTGTFSWTPDFDQAGSYDILFTAFEPSTMSDTETVTITVNNTNRAPFFFTITDESVDEDQEVGIYPVVDDPDPEHSNIDSLTLSVTTLPEGATFGYVFNGDVWGWEFLWTPSFEQAGVYEIEFVITDGDLFGYDTVVVTVNNVNRAPSFAVSVDDQIIDEM